LRQNARSGAVIMFFHGFIYSNCKWQNSVIGI